MSVPERRPLNKDEIISQPDIPGYYVSGQFIPEDSAEAAKLTAAQKTSSKGVARRITYADGRVEVWLRNEGQSATTGGENNTGYGTKISETRDAEVTKEWDRRVDEANKREEAKPKPEEMAPTQQRTAREEAEIAANAALPPDQDPRSETNAERAARAERTIKEQKAEADRQAAANKPTTVATNTTEPYIVERMPDGQLRSTPNPNYKGPEQKPGSTLQIKGGDGKTYLVPIGADGKPGTPTAIDVPGEGPTREDKPYVDKKTGKQLIQRRDVDKSKGIDRTYFVDPATGQEVTLDESTNIKGVPPYTPDLTRPGAGLIDRAKQLDELVAAGTITWDQRNQVLTQDRVLASSVANEFNTGVAILREDYQNQVSQRNVDVNNAQFRANLANQHMQNAIGLVSKFLPYLGQTPGDAGKLFTGMMAAQLATATAYGGMKDYPREQMAPGLKSWAERATAGATGTPSPTQTPPNAIGAGSVPGSITPSIAPPPAPAGAPTGPTNLIDADGRPREFTPASSSTPGMAPQASMPAVPQANPQIAALFGQTMPAPRQPEEDSWRQMAMDRRDLMLGQQYAGAGLPEIPQPVGMDLNASMGPMLAPVLDTRIPGLTPDLDRQARAELESEWLS